MFKNIGFKIMTLAEISCWICFVISLIVGIINIYNGIVAREVSLILINGILWIILGPLLSWIGSFLLYGFGRLIENSDIIANRDER